MRGGGENNRPGILPKLPRDAVRLSSFNSNFFESLNSTFLYNGSNVEALRHAISRFRAGIGLASNQV